MDNGPRRGYDEQPLLVHHVAKICGISPRTVRWAAARGTLKGFKDPRTPKIWRFWRTDVYAYRASRGAWREIAPSVRHSKEQATVAKGIYTIKLISLK